MSELNDSSELQKYSSAVLYVLSAVSPPTDYIVVIMNNFIDLIKSSTVRLVQMHLPFSSDKMCIYSHGASESMHCRHC